MSSATSSHSGTAPIAFNMLFCEDKDKEYNYAVKCGYMTAQRFSLSVLILTNVDCRGTTSSIRSMFGSFIYFIDS